MKITIGETWDKIQYLFFGFIFYAFFVTNARMFIDQVPLWNLFIGMWEVVLALTIYASVWAGGEQFRGSK